MYLPSHFEVTDVEAMRALIAEHPLATLVTVDADGLHADHIPVLHEADSSAYGRLIAHVAKRNDAWRRDHRAVDALVIVQGVSAYISPNWYLSKQEHHRVVPTYNYAVVHAYGPVIVHEDAKWVRGMVGKLTKRFESGMPSPWKMGDAPSDFLSEQVDNIVGIEIPISRMIGKWKVSQNRIVEDRLGAIDGLRSTDNPIASDMAELIRAAMDKG